MQIRRLGQAALLSALATVVSPACSKPSPQDGPQANPRSVTPSAVEVPVAPPPLGRPELVDAVALAADAYAAAAPTPDIVRQLGGRPFRVRLPFGCLGPASADTSLRYEWTAKTKDLRLSATPQDWTKDAGLKKLIGAVDAEAVEGFWVHRPWLREDACPSIRPPGVSEAPPSETPAPPPAPTATPAPTPMSSSASPESVALVQAFDAEDSRLQKRTRRPYEIKLSGQTAPPATGYRLVVEGRILGDEVTPPIACRSVSPEERPTCFVRVKVDRVAFESGDGDRLAEWPS